jgi:ElaB/YqjD/DUF883 family membrane-anchored ribosome-binding protein
MARKNARSSAADVSAIEELMQGLEARLSRLNTKGKSDAAGASHEISEFVTDAIARFTERLGAHSINGEANQAGAEALDIGTSAVKKVWAELEQRPLTTLAVAAGVGYLLGLVGRRD